MALTTATNVRPNVRVRTGRIVARALDDTFTGTTHMIVRYMPKSTGGRIPLFGSLDGPNGFPGDTGRVAF
ncbi:hypothetical protein SEA_JACKO_6 [Microbacterium phage Jacko]|nr:hypothetical protein SEA_JACKO_115 [Microbacterium phage Jacko]AXC37973.1 hypothetical protein SEA_JACKO_6 [Microbacterium phage Jacko]QAU07341.1 hypothetical protein SEA_ALLEB_114 [Microbacterium phage Alleb]